MTTYQTITERLIEWASSNKNVRALILIGSRARATEKADQWSDMDVILVAREISAYIETADWVERFASPLLTFTEVTFDGAYERRVLYEGFLDVDFALSEPTEFSAALEMSAVSAIFERGYWILLDKDDWTSQIEAHRESAPTQEIAPHVIANEIHDYWYHAVWTTKKIKRGELWTAMNCLNCYMGAKLLWMIERLSELSSDGPVDTWHNGRLLERWADPALLQRLPGCFSDYDQRALMATLHHQMNVYHEIASQVAAQRGLSYPADEAEAVQEWIARVERERVP